MGSRLTWAASNGVPQEEGRKRQPQHLRGRGQGGTAGTQAPGSGMERARSFCRRLEGATALPCQTPTASALGAS